MTHASEPTALDRLISGRFSRRSLLKGVAASGALATLPLSLQGCLPSEAPVDLTLPFRPIAPSTMDALILPEGFKYDLVACWEDEFAPGLHFGFNADWTGYLPIDLLQQGMDLSAVQRGFQRLDADSSEGLLIVNHEHPDSSFVGPWDGTKPKSSVQREAEKRCVGVSILHVKREAQGAWKTVPDDRLSRRLDALSPMLLTGPAAHLDGGPEAIGTLANCSGGLTPWGTILTCEENHGDFTTDPAKGGYGWEKDVYGRRHYGYVVEVAPFDPGSVPRKHTALGRFRHENVAIRVGIDGTVVAYMGNDRRHGCVYKFVCSQKLTSTELSQSPTDLLEHGTLYAADFDGGRWLALDYDSQPALREKKRDDGSPRFASQAEVLASAHRAALTLGATPCPRPEDVEVHPEDGTVYIAFTNDTKADDPHGRIVRLVEDSGAPDAPTFNWSVFAEGGQSTGFSCPDNMVFDAEANLWISSDVSSKSIGEGKYEFLGHNGLYRVATKGEHAGVARQFASSPFAAEFTGPSFTPDGRTLFLSVQHPGKRSGGLPEPTSRWPHYGKDVPRPSVVAITGF